MEKVYGSTPIGHFSGQTVRARPPWTYKSLIGSRMGKMGQTYPPTFHPPSAIDWGRVSTCYTPTSSAFLLSQLEPRENSSLLRESAAPPLSKSWHKYREEVKQSNPPENRVEEKRGHAQFVSEVEEKLTQCNFAVFYCWERSKNFSLLAKIYCRVRPLDFFLAKRMK